MGNEKGGQCAAISSQSSPSASHAPSLPGPQELLEFKCVKPMLTVHTFLAERGALRLLEDPLLATATAEIIAGTPHHHMRMHQ